MSWTFFCFSVITTLLMASLPVRAGFGIYVDATDGKELRRIKGEEAVVMGRVESSEAAGGELSLMLDGGHLKIVVAIAKPGAFDGKLVEVRGNIEEVVGAKEGEPKLKIFQRTGANIRIIPETPASAASKLIVRQKPEKLDWWFHQPSGPAPAAAVLAGVSSFRNPQEWTRMDGTKVTIPFNTWKWRERSGPDLKTREWVVAMLYAPDGPTYRWYYPEDLRLIPADEDRLLLMLWKNYQETLEQSKNRTPAPPPTVEGDALTATEAWVDRITRWGETPLLNETKIQRLPGPGDFGNLPDLRKLTEVSLRRASPAGRKEGNLILLDWAMTAEPSATKVQARIRWEDGVEETVPALDVFPNVVYKFGGGGSGTIGQAEAGLIYMRDWTRFGERREKAPGGELKIRAVRQFLKSWWDSPFMAFQMIHEKDVAKRAGEQRAKEEARNSTTQLQRGDRDLAAKMRDGFALKFPGLPPAGFKECPNPAPDRTLLKPVPQDLTKHPISDEVANLMAAMLWWDATGVMALPEKLGGRRREEMLLTLVERYWKGNNLQENFCDKLMEGRCFPQLTYDRDLSAANLARLTTGHHAVVLNFMVWDARQALFRMSVLVHTASADGEVVFSVRGEVGTGRLKPVDLPGNKRLSPGDQRLTVKPLELELTGSPALIEYLKPKGRRLVLSDPQYSQILVITPWAVHTAAPPVKK